MMHPAHDPDLADRGDRLAEKLAAGFGSWTYLIWQSAAIVVWVVLNIVGIIGRWDVYPFILLNLVFSTQAAYAAPIILLAQNRQAAIDKLRADLDHEHLTTNTEMTAQIHAKVVGS